ncbi:hypothetical protein VN97_g13096 [Penicillium thymicola]|uniref:Uncharacterized protein n=1 Tax=Penicillium thymicola TaxID=293382 RepID=A0AAI9T4H8_PENTH|nr:hypothetical protein VN97_g13096 [Penicillium thymicola]
MVGVYNEESVPKWRETFINQPSGRAVTRPSHLPWSSGDDFRLSLIPISAGDRGSIPRGRDFFFALFFFYPYLHTRFPLPLLGVPLPS